jgi:hypothetical protein
MHNQERGIQLSLKFKNKQKSGVFSNLSKKSVYLTGYQVMPPKRPDGVRGEVISFHVYVEEQHHGNGSRKGDQRGSVMAMSMATLCIAEEVYF